jgi:Ca2+/Na+ antiporter
MTDIAGILAPLIIMAVSCLIIWRSASGFEVASDFIGRKLSKGVKGATLNAIASSMPEFLSTVFFLFYLEDVNGFSGGLGITAGSAIFNIMIIPALVILVVLMKNPRHIISVTRTVLLRDGIVLIIIVFILVLILELGHVSLRPVHGIILLAAYLVYLLYMFLSMGRLVARDKVEPYQPLQEGRSLKFLLSLNLQGLIVGKKDLKAGTAWILLLISTGVMSLGTWLLVYSTEWLSNSLHIPILYVAVILSAAASSVPDTVISVKDAKKGNYDDAVSNALGSNIFDISFALGLPLFLYTVITGKPIVMDTEIVSLSSELWMYLLGTTVIGLVIFISGKRLTMIKAFLFLVIYACFIFFIIGQAGHLRLAERFYQFILHLVNIIEGLFL